MEKRKKNYNSFFCEQICFTRRAAVSFQQVKSTDKTLIVLVLKQVDLPNSLGAPYVVIPLALDSLRPSARLQSTGAKMLSS